MESDQGYRIAITRTGTLVQFSAFGPEIVYHEYKLSLRTQYLRGTPIPQQRTLLGVFTNQEEAKHACLHHVSPAPP